MTQNFMHPDQRIQEMIEKATSPVKESIDKWNREREMLVAESFKKKFGKNPYENDALKVIKCYNVQTGENTWTEYYVFATRCFLELDYRQSFVFDYNKKTFSSDIDIQPIIPEKLTIYMDENGKLVFNNII